MSDDDHLQLPGVLSTPQYDRNHPRRSPRLNRNNDDANVNANRNNDRANRNDERINGNNNDDDENNRRNLLPRLEHNDEDSDSDENNNNNDGNNDGNNNNDDANERRRQRQIVDRFTQQSALNDSFQRMMEEIQRNNQRLMQRLNDMQNEHGQLRNKIEEQQKELNEKMDNDRRATIIPGLQFVEIQQLRNKENTSIYNTLSKPMPTINEECPRDTYHKILFNNKDEFKFDSKTDVIDYLWRFDTFCDEIGANITEDGYTEYKTGVPGMGRHFYITNYYLSKPLRQLYFQAKEEGEKVSTYDGLKTWLYKVREGKYNIEKRKEQLLNWKYNHDKLEDGIKDYLAKIRRYILEIRFALKHGISENDIIKVDEKQLFKHFLNAVTVEERKYLHTSFQAIGGQYVMAKLKLLCKAVDKQLHPGLGIKPIIKKKSASEINAIETSPHGRCNGNCCQNEEEIFAMNGYRNGFRNRKPYYRNNRRKFGRFNRKPRKWCRVCRNNTHWTSQCRRNDKQRRFNRGRSFVNQRKLRCPVCGGPHVESKCWIKYPEQKKEYQAKLRMKKNKYPQATTSDILALEAEFGDSDIDQQWTYEDQKLYNDILAIQEKTESNVKNIETPSQEARVEAQPDPEQLEMEFAEYMSSEEDEMEQHEVNIIQNPNDDYGYDPRQD